MCDAPRTDAEDRHVGELVFADHRIAEIIEAPERLMRVYVVNGVSYPTKNSARKALTLSRQRDAGEEEVPSWFYPELPEPEQEYRSAYQVIVEGEIIEELPTLRMAQEKVRNVSNKQAHSVSVALIRFKQSRDTVDRELSELAELIAMYSFEDMEDVLNEYDELENELFFNSPAAFEYFLNLKVGNTKDAIAWGFVIELHEKAMMLRRGLADDADTAFVPPMEMARHMVDRERVMERGTERAHKVSEARSAAQARKEKVEETC